MAWRVAKCIDTLRKQINDAFPKRSKANDGTIGDAAHASRSSDHNPWVKDGKMGVVTAVDFTHDPVNGVDCHKLAADLIAFADPRLKYIIWNAQIWNPSISPKWRPYSGANSHKHHIHISVSSHKARYDDVTPWKWRTEPSIPK
jgi:hypothetical protein